jgi:hypothetical protein
MATVPAVAPRVEAQRERLKDRKRPAALALSQRRTVVAAHHSVHDRPRELVVDGVRALRHLLVPHMVEVHLLAWRGCLLALLARLLGGALQRLVIGGPDALLATLLEERTGTDAHPDRVDLAHAGPRARRRRRNVLARAVREVELPRQDEKSRQQAAAAGDPFFAAVHGG